MISYSQNFEDVMLWRALKNIKKGSYIDIGAAWEEDHSVTKWFYSQGWSGINIEPNPEMFRDLQLKRTRDINLDVAVSDVVGEACFQVVNNTGLSSLNLSVVEEHVGQGYSKHEIKVQTSTLSTIYSEYVPYNIDVHFLKIDVEGFEEKVVIGNDWNKNRPWIVVVEATIPMSQVEDYASVENILLKYDYLFVYADGLNRYYLAKEHSELLEFFKYPPNVFDGYTLSSQVELEKKLSHINQELEHKSQELHDQWQRASIAEKELNVANQKCKVSRQETEVARQETEVARHEVEVSRQETEVARHEVEVSRQGAEVINQKLMDLNDRYIETHYNLNCNISELEAANKHLDDRILFLYRSTSWRLTKPLRLVRKVLRRLMRPIKLVKKILFKLKLTNLKQKYRIYKYSKIIEKSGLFDYDFYLKSYPDIKMNAIKHYLCYGATEGRNPSSEFNTNDYLRLYDDIDIKIINPFVHYILYGKNEKRVPKALLKNSNFLLDDVVEQEVLVKDDFESSLYKWSLGGRIDG